MQTAEDRLRFTRPAKLMKAVKARVRWNSKRSMWNIARETNVTERGMGDTVKIDFKVLFFEVVYVHPANRQLGKETIAFNTFKESIQSLNGIKRVCISFKEGTLVSLKGFADNFRRVCTRS